MSKLKNLAEKELANFQEERTITLKAIEQTEQALINRRNHLKELDKAIAEFQSFLKKASKEK